MHHIFGEDVWPIPFFSIFGSIGREMIMCRVPHWPTTTWLNYNIDSTFGNGYGHENSKEYYFI